MIKPASQPRLALFTVLIPLSALVLFTTPKSKPDSWNPNQGDRRTGVPFVSGSPKMREKS